MLEDLSFIKLPSPLQGVDSLSESQGFWIKRDDLIHPEISGNKFRKLKGYLQNYHRQNAQGILTYGGAFSNHLYATAALCYKLNIVSAGIVRGENKDRNNPTLNFCRAKGMQLHFVSRGAYRDKEKDPTIQKIIRQYPQFLCVPEGGNGEEGLVGIESIAEELRQQIPSQSAIVIVPMGTGTTFSGLVRSVDKHFTILGIPVLKNRNLENEITSFLLKDHAKRDGKYEINHDYHFGGYARFDDTLISFIKNFEESYAIDLDPIYTAKAMYGTFDLWSMGYFDSFEDVVFLHTGGLQGRRGFDHRFPGLLS